MKARCVECQRVFDLLDTADALNTLDPIAYKCGWIDWCDAEGIDTDELDNDYTFDSDNR